MVIDASIVKRHIKPKADSTLLNMKKADLIEYIRTLERNYNVAVSFNEQQARNIEAMIKNGDIPPQWISVEERLPETDGKNTFAYNVLVYIPKRDGCNQHGVYIGKLKGIKADDGSGNFWGLKTQACDWTVWGFSYFEQPVVTHWMPLPEPPREDANG